MEARKMRQSEMIVGKNNSNQNWSELLINETFK